MPQQLCLSRANQEDIHIYLKLLGYPKKYLIRIGKEIHPTFHHPRASNLSAETQEKSLGNPGYSLIRTLFSKHERILPSKHSQNIKQVNGKNKIPWSLLPQHYLI